MLKLYTRAQARLNSLRDEDGATAVEYGLIIALISIVIVVALVALVPGIQAAIGDAVALLGAGGAGGGE
jgi:pilus assembly protein Flp/PilA